MADVLGLHSIENPHLTEYAVSLHRESLFSFPFLFWVILGRNELIGSSLYSAQCGVEGVSTI
jgi:hypothetical protein